MIKHTQAAYKLLKKAWLRVGLLMEFPDVIFWTLGLLGFAVSFYVATPGLMSEDSIAQLTQAKGGIGFNNWHPPLMSAVWRLFILLTHHLSSMLVFQVLLFWLALVLLAIFVYRQVQSRTKAVLVFSVGLLPFTANFQGVIWSDVEMAISLFLAVAILLWVRGGTRQKLWLLGALLLLFYALSMRYNAVFAAAPLAVLIFIKLIPGKKRLAIGLACVFVAVCLASSSVMYKLLHVDNQNPQQAIMLDDLTRLDKGQQVSLSNESFQKVIEQIINTCNTDLYLSNYFWACATPAQQTAITRADNKEFTRWWLSSIAHHPVAYLSGRARAYLYFLFPRPVGDSYAYLPQGIVANSYHLRVAHAAALDIMNGYVGFWARDFAFIFRPYFWLLLDISALIYLYIQRRMPYREAYAAILLSSLLYLIGYFPMVTATDERFIYWSSLATSAAVLLMALTYKSMNGSR